MTGTILCPIDFEADSRRALAMSANIASATGARLQVVHVVPEGNAGEALARARSELQRAVPPASARLAVEARVLQGAAPAAAIVAAAEVERAELIVIGAHGKTGWRRALLGSVAERVVQLAPCPVLTVGGTAPARDARAFRRILCSCDFSAASDAALRHAARLAAASGAKLIVLHVAEPAPPMADLGIPVGIAPVPEPEILDRLLSALEARVAKVTDGVPRARCEVKIGFAAAAIVEHARDEDADLVVVGSHGRRGWKHALLGSTAERVVRTADRPVLVVKPAAVRRYWSSAAATPPAHRVRPPRADAGCATTPVRRGDC